MAVPEPARAVGVVLVAALAVVAVSVGGTLLASGPAPAPTGPPAPEGTVEHPEYDPGTLLAERVDRTGRLSPKVDAGGQTVLIDDGHANRLARDDIRPFLRALVLAGFEVRFTDDDTDLETALSAADAYVVMDPGRTFSEAEVAAVQRFATDGGRFLMLGEPTRTVQSSGFQSVPVVQYSNLGPLARAFDMNYRSRYVSDQRAYGSNFRNLLVEPAGASTLTDGVDRLAVFTAAAIDYRTGTTAFETGPDAVVEGAATTGPWPVVVRQGNVVAVGDTTFLGPKRYTTADNEVFIENLVEFLAG